jgi:hypothetical protein
VLSSLPVYLLTLIKVPRKFLKEIDKTRKKFLWAGDGELTGGKCKVAWPKVCTPQPNGGLGIKDLELSSQLLRLRWLWFGWDSTQRPWDGLQLPISDDDRAIFNAATVVSLGNGKKASFWNSRWLNGESLATRFPLLYNHSKKKNRTVASAFGNNRWINDIDHNLTPHIISEYLMLWEHLEGVSLSDSQQDLVSWILTADGTYSAKSVYDMHFMGTMQCATASQTWTTKAPPKCKFFTWLMLQNMFWTAARLQVRGWPNEYFC